MKGSQSQRWFFISYNWTQPVLNLGSREITNKSSINQDFTVSFRYYIARVIHSLKTTSHMVCPWVGGRNIRRRNFRRRNFRRRTFRRTDFSPYGFFAVGIFAVRNFRRTEFSPYGIFAVWNFRRTEFSPYGFFAVILQLKGFMVYSSFAKIKLSSAKQFHPSMVQLWIHEQPFLHSVQCCSAFCGCC